MPEALAVRALELLRATALELSIESERAPPSQKPLEFRPEGEMQSRLAPPATSPEAPIVVAAMGADAGGDHRADDAVAFARLRDTLSAR